MRMAQTIVFVDDVPRMQTFYQGNVLQITTR
jgi:hypothetical protein